MVREKFKKAHTMNEELVQRIVDQCVVKRERHGTTVDVLQSRKFAEMIVRECMDVVRDINQEYDGGSTVVNAAQEIAEHFGIKE